MIDGNNADQEENYSISGTKAKPSCRSSDTLPFKSFVTLTIALLTGNTMMPFGASCWTSTSGMRLAAAETNIRSNGASRDSPITCSSARRIIACSNLYFARALLHNSFGSVKPLKGCRPSQNPQTSRFDDKIWLKKRTELCNKALCKILLPEFHQSGHDLYARHLATVPNYLCKKRGSPARAGTDIQHFAAGRRSQ